MSRTIRISLAIAAISIFFAFSLSLLKISAPLEELCHYSLFWMRNLSGLNQNVDPRIALLPLDENFFASYDKEPLKRSDMGAIMGKLLKWGARGVYLDIFFRKRDAYGEDKAFRDAISGYPGRVIFPCTLQNGFSRGKFSIIEPHPDPCSGFSSGYVNFPDPTGRRYITSMRVSTAANAAGKLPVAFILAGVLTGSTFELQSGQKGEIPINFYFPSSPGSSARHILSPAGVYQVLQAGEDDEAMASMFRDRLVLIGDTTWIGKDWFNSPAGSISGLELIANSVNTLLKGRQPIMVSPLATYAAGLVMGLAISTLTLIFGTFAGIAGLISLTGMAIVAAGKAFSSSNFVINLAPSLVAALFSFVATLYWIDSRWTRLGIYVSKSVKQKVLLGDAGKDLSKKRIAIMFADIRGFTALSDRLPAENIVEILNDYFDTMAEIITAQGHDGTIDKFMGDGIMAFFGDPLDLDNPVSRAVDAGLMMCSAFDRLALKWHASGLFGDAAAPPSGFGIGVGVAVGEVHVGNIGARKAGFMDYTCIGREVNLASRLQGEAPGGVLLVSREAALEISGDLNVESQGEKKIKGFDEPVQIFKVIAK